MARTRTLENQLSLTLFDPGNADEKKPPSYEQPCGVRDYCGAYHCETGGCDGQRGWCNNAQNAYTPGKSILEKRKTGKKSFCAPWQTWTNCREVGHCVYAAWKDARK